MTENEAIKILKRDLAIHIENKALPDGIEAIKTAIKTLEEIQQYRAIGTVEDIQKVLSFLGDENKRNIIDDLKLLNEYKATGLTPELIEAMQGHNIAMINDLEEYQATGTVEEIKALKLKEDIFDRNIKNCKEIGMTIRLMAIYEFAERMKADLQGEHWTQFCTMRKMIDKVAEQMRKEV